MEELQNVRAVYLVPFIEILRGLGAPVERELENARLPVNIEEHPEDRISNVLVSRFCERIELKEGLEDLGWLGSSHYSFSSLSQSMQAALRSRPTVKSRLQRLAYLARLESSDAIVGIVQSGASIEIYCDRAKPEEVRGLHICEWTRLMVLIEVIRDVMGQTWSPDVISFQSNFSVCDDARQTHPNTRFVKNANRTSITMPSSVLAAGTAFNRPTCSLQGSEISSVEGFDYLKSVLRPYVREGTLRIDLLAEIAGTSTRSLQRVLQKDGFSYSQLLEKTRFDMAVEKLQESGNPLVEIAMDLGYENQSNFSRSFKRISGMSPGAYRHQMLEQGQFANSGAI